MKTLIIVRHAKSSWAEPGQKDFDRPLSERGKKDAPEMAAKLLASDVRIDAFVSSPAKRARKTCRAFAEAYGRSKDDIIFFDELYHAPAAVFYETVAKLNDDARSVALFAHNPGISEFANSLYKNKSIGEMPTCAAFAVCADIKHWKDFEIAGKKFLFFKYPKEG